jgi:hypothetical protein
MAESAGGLAGRRDGIAAKTGTSATSGQGLNYSRVWKIIILTPHFLFLILIFFVMKITHKSR